jgi:hypothetical protein
MKRPTRKDMTRFLLGLAALVALYLTHPTVTGNAASAPAAAAPAAAPPAADRGSEARNAPPPADPGEIHDAQSDGGYWEWLEREGSTPRNRDRSRD